VDKTTAVQKTDVTLTQVYGKKSILILQRIENEDSEIGLYQLSTDGAEFKRTHVLRMANVGADIKFQIVDNLIVAHDTKYHSTMMFDIELASEVRGSVLYQLPIAKQRALSQSYKGQKFGENGHTQRLEMILAGGGLFLGFVAMSFSA
jgi:hypothetical protein